MFKRLRIAVLIFALLSSITSYSILAAATSISTTSRFVDMPDDWSTEALERAFSNGLINGDNNHIMPNDNLTRSQMGTIINRAFGAEKMNSLVDYTDVPRDVWYYNEMRKSVYMGTLKGSDGRLNPERMVNREEVIDALARVFKLSGADQSILDNYLDKNDISQWAKDGVASMIAAGYISGSEGRINPKNSITRAEFAKIMDNLVKTYYRYNNTYSADAFGNVVVNVPKVVLENMTINGDLIIADGVGSGGVLLRNVVVAGRTVIRGGGSNTVHISENSRLGTVLFARIGGMARMLVDQQSSVGVITVGGSEDVILEGNLARVIVKSADITVVIQKSTIQDIVIEADNVMVLTNSLADVKGISIVGLNASIKTKVGSEIGKVSVYNNGARISGPGKVLSVLAEASDVKVTTDSTEVTAGLQAEEVFFGDTMIEPGSSSAESYISTELIPAENLSGEGKSLSDVPGERLTILSNSAIINTYSGSMTMSVIAGPETVTTPDVIWGVINGTGTASITTEGVLTAVSNGLVTVKATTTDESKITAFKVITITGQ